MTDAPKGPEYRETVQGSLGGCAIAVVTPHDPGRVWLSAWTSYNDTVVVTPAEAREYAKRVMAAADVAEGKPICCAAKAEALEPTFTLLGRDAAARAAIVRWIEARIELGLNELGDEQIQSAIVLSGEVAEYARQRAEGAEDQVNRIDSLLRFLAAWPQGRLHLVVYVHGGETVAAATDVDRTFVLGPVRKPTVDDCVVELMQQALDVLSKSTPEAGA